MVERGYSASYSMRVERECLVEEIHCSFKWDNCLLIMRFISRWYWPSSLEYMEKMNLPKHHGGTQCNCIGLRPALRPVEPHAMIEVPTLLPVINQVGRNVASIFCHEIIKKVSCGSLGHRFSKCSVRSPRAPREKPRGSASYSVTYVFIFRNLLWGSVNYGQSLHGLHNTKTLRTPALGFHGTPVEKRCIRQFHENWSFKALRLRKILLTKLSCRASLESFIIF